ncbi:hypothetical protein BDV18DRAFT_140614 [Aspergillus unguis]
MGSPLQVGDIYLLGRLAFKIGHAFSKGRKSAPAEFHEVENQLYSLSAALQALRNELRDRPSNLQFSLDDEDDDEDVNVIAQIVESCGETLHHLEGVVEKYSIIRKRKEGRSSGVSIFCRWNEGIRSGWKSVLWTKEGGDLMTLRSNLAVHTNSLNLLIGVLVNSQTRRIEARVNDNYEMLHEVHSWFTKNLKDVSVTLQRQETQTTLAEYQNLPLVETFEIHESHGISSRLVCPRASINPDYLAGGSSTVDLFNCHCPVSGETASHKTRVGSFGLSPFSICARIASSQRIYMLYKIVDKSSGVLKSLFVKNIARSDVPDIEGLLQQLTLDQAKPLLQQGANNLLCYTSPSEQARPHILHLVTDTRSFKNSIESVSFNIPSQKSIYERSDIETVHILHYKNTDLQGLMKIDEESQNFQFQDHAEIILCYSTSSQSEDGDITRMTLHLTQYTQFHLSRDQSALVLESIKCIGHTAVDDAAPIEDVEVTIHFSTRDSCSSFTQKIEDMRVELFILALQYPTATEKKLVRIQASTVYTEHFQVADAEVCILQCADTGRFRLSIVSRDGLTVISQQLPESFLETCATEPGQCPFKSPTYVVQLNDTGTRTVKNYAQGFSVFGFSDAEGIFFPTIRQAMLMLYGSRARAPTGTKEYLQRGCGIVFGAG